MKRLSQVLVLGCWFGIVTDAAAALLFYDVDGAFDIQDIETPPGFWDAFSVPVSSGDLDFELSYSPTLLGTTLGSLSRYSMTGPPPPAAVNGEASMDVAVSRRFRLQIDATAETDAGIRFRTRVDLDGHLNNGGSPDENLGSGTARAAAGFTLTGRDSTGDDFFLDGEITCEFAPVVAGCGLSFGGTPDIQPMVEANDLSIDPVTGEITGGVTLSATLPDGSTLGDTSMFVRSLVDFGVTAGFQFPEAVESDVANTATFTFFSDTPGVEVQAVPLLPSFALLAPALFGLYRVRREPRGETDLRM